MRFQTFTNSTGSIAAGPHQYDFAIGPSVFNIAKIVVVPSDPTGIWKLEIFKRSTQSAPDEQYSTQDSQLTTFYDPSDVSGGAALEGFVIPYEDLDATGALHTKITTNITQSFTITVIYEEVPQYSAAGLVGFGRVVTARITEQLVMPYAGYLGAVNSGGTGTVRLIGLDTLNGTANTVIVGNSGSVAINGLLDMYSIASANILFGVHNSNVASISNFSGIDLRVNSSTADQTAALIQGRLSTTTNATRTGSFTISVPIAGVLTALIQSATAAVILPQGNIVFTNITSGNALLKNSGAVMVCRLGDDSAYASFQASTFQAFSGGYFFSTTNTSSPLLTQSGAVMQCRLGDNSGYAAFDAGSYKVGGVAGLTFTGATATLTIVGGIITAKT